MKAYTSSHAFKRLLQPLTEAGQQPSSATGGGGGGNTPPPSPSEAAALGVRHDDAMPFAALLAARVSAIDAIVAKRVVALDYLFRLHRPSPSSSTTSASSSANTASVAAPAAAALPQPLWMGGVALSLADLQAHFDHPVARSWCREGHEGGDDNDRGGPPDNDDDGHDVATHGGFRGDRGGNSEATWTETATASLRRQHHRDPSALSSSSSSSAALKHGTGGGGGERGGSFHGKHHAGGISRRVQADPFWLEKHVTAWFQLGYGLSSLLTHPTEATSGVELACCTVELLLEMEHATASTTAKRAAAAKQLRQFREDRGVQARRPYLPEAAPVFNPVTSPFAVSKPASSLPQASTGTLSSSPLTVGSGGAVVPSSPWAALLWATAGEQGCEGNVAQTRRDVCIDTSRAFAVLGPALVGSYAFHTAPTLAYPVTYTLVVMSLLETLGLAYRKLLDFDTAADDAAFGAFLSFDAFVQKAVLEVMADELEAVATAKARSQWQKLLYSVPVYCPGSSSASSSSSAALGQPLPGGGGTPLAAVAAGGGVGRMAPPPLAAT